MKTFFIVNVYVLWKNFVSYQGYNLWCDSGKTTWPTKWNLTYYRCWDHVKAGFKPFPNLFLFLLSFVCNKKKFRNGILREGFIRLTVMSCWQDDCHSFSIAFFSYHICRCLCFHSIFNFDIFRSNRYVCQSYNGGLWSPPQRACTEKSKLNVI